MLELWNTIPVINKIFIVGGLSAMFYGIYLFIRDTVRWYFYKRREIEDKYDIEIARIRLIEFQKEQLERDD